MSSKRGRSTSALSLVGLGIPAFATKLGKLRKQTESELKQFRIDREKARKKESFVKSFVRSSEITAPTQAKIEAFVRSCEIT